MRALTLATALGLLGASPSGAAAPPAPEKSPPAAADPGLLNRPWTDDVLYFVLVDRFSDGDLSNDAGADPKAKGAFHGGDLKGLLRNLDEIASLGVTALWVNPLVKNIDGFVTGAGFPDWGYHGYWADDFTRLDPRFGTEADLTALVRECHRRGLKVLLDVVYNHAGYGSHYLSDPRTRGWLRSNEHGGCGDDDLTSCLSGLPDWKTEEPAVRDWLLEVQLGWARRFGLDGFRLDTVKHLDHAFWQEHRRRAAALLGRPFFLLGEVWGGDKDSLDAYFQTDELDAGFDFGFQGSALGFVMGRGRAVAFDRYLASRERVRPGHLLAHFLSSHDVPGALHQLKGDKDLFRLAAVLELTASGLPVIYYGEEVGRPGGEWPDNRSDFPWGDRKIAPGAGLPRDEGLRAFYVKLLAARRGHPALTRGRHEGLVTGGDLYVFSRRDTASGDAVVVAVNRSGVAGEAEVPAPVDWAGSACEDVLTGRVILPRDGKLHLGLGPKQAVVLVRSSRKP